MSLRIAANPVDAVELLADLNSESIASEFYISGKTPRGGIDFAINGSTTVADQGDVVRKGGQQLFRAWDDTEQFRVIGFVGAANNLFVQGAQAGSDPVIGARGSDTNIDINYAAKGTGGHEFYNGSGTILRLVDDASGLGMNNRFTISGAATGVDPKIDSNRGAIFNVADTFELNFTVNNQTMFKARRLTGTTTDRYWTLSGGTDQARLTVEGAAANAFGYIQAKGTGNLVFASTGGTLLTVDPNGFTSAIVNSVLIRGAQTGNPATIRALGETNASLLLGPKQSEAGTLRLEVPNIINRYLVTGITFNTPTTGFSIVISDTVAELHLTPAGTLATGTVTLPAAPYDGQTVTVSTTQTVTALTVSPSAGQTVVGAPTTITAADPFTMRYRTSTTQWRRVG